MSTQAEVDAAIAALKSEVERETSIELSARALILGIDARIAQAIAAFQASNPSIDVSALSTITESIRHSSADLSAAVAANTPAAPVPAPAPTTPA